MTTLPFFLTVLRQEFHSLGKNEFQVTIKKEIAFSTIFFYIMNNLKVHFRSRNHLINTRDNKPVSMRFGNRFITYFYLLKI
jgi:hypothetical protein